MRLTIPLDMVLLQQHLSNKVRVIEHVYPQVYIHDWCVYYDPKTYLRDSEGMPCHWVARQPSRFCNAVSLRNLLAFIEEDLKEP